MLINQPAFWNWLFTIGEEVLPLQLWKELKETYPYKKEPRTSNYEGKTYDWNIETLQLDFPITPTYGFTGLLTLSENKEFTELLYLKVGEEHYYLLGWYDCHNHEMVFRIEEWEQITSFLEQQSSDQPWVAAATGLYLARFVPMVSEQVGEQLAKKCWSYYQQLCGAEGAMKLTIQEECYGEKQLEDKSWQITYQPRALKIGNSPLEFWSATQLEWVPQEQGKYYLEGDYAHSLRAAIYDSEAPPPRNLQEEEASPANLSFPLQHWQELLQQTAL